MKNPNKSRLGFTLIELLVVVLIIGILAAVALPQYQKAVMKTRFVHAMNACDSLFKAAEVYRLANDAWPTTLDQLDIEMPGQQTNTTITGDNFACALLPEGSGFVPSIVCDVKDGPVSMRRFFNEPTNRYCVTLQNNKMGNEVCKSVSDNATPRTGSDDYWYLIP